MKITRKDVLFAIITNVVLLLGIPMTGPDKIRGRCQPVEKNPAA
jgi:hypothetical protein